LADWSLQKFFDAGPLLLCCSLQFLSKSVEPQDFTAGKEEVLNTLFLRINFLELLLEMNKLLNLIRIGRPEKPVMHVLVGVWLEDTYVLRC